MALCWMRMAQDVKSLGNICFRNIRQSGAIFCPLGGKLGLQDRASAKFWAQADQYRRLPEYLVSARQSGWFTGAERLPFAEMPEVERFSIVSSTSMIRKSRDIRFPRCSAASHALAFRYFDIRKDNLRAIIRTRPTAGLRMQFWMNFSAADIGTPVLFTAEGLDDTRHGT